MMLSVHEKLYKFCPTCKTKLIRKPIDNKKFWFCPNCGFTFWNNPKPVASIILINNNKVLMLQRASPPLKGYWCLPGGFIQYEETPEEGVIREAKEEIGNNVILDGLVGVYRIDNDPRGINIDIIYKARAKGEVKLSEEHKNYKFFDLDNLPQKIAYKHREAIKEWK